MAAPSGLIVAWPSTIASIPAGWTRVAAMDANFIRGDATAGGTGGSNTHVHTASDHVHQGSDHVHGITTSSESSGSVGVAAGATITGAANDAHTHDAADTGDTSLPTSASVGSLTTSSTGNQPNRFTVIWIESDGTTDIAQGSIVYWNAASPPPNHAICTGASGTPDLRNYFLKGANAGNNGGAATAGSSHTHTTPHTHTDLHEHTEPSQTDLEALPVGSPKVSGGVANIISQQHLHPFGGDLVTSSETANVSASSDTTAGQNVEPPWIKLHHIQKTSSSSILPTGIIAVWDGLIGAIPANWQACDGTNGSPDLNGGLFIKGANGDGERGDTGGSTTHSHTYTHAHEYVAHNHTEATATDAPVGMTSATAGGGAAGTTHDHDVVIQNNVGGDTANANINVSTSSHTPAYISVIFIQLMQEAKTDADSYVVAMSETESMVVIATETDSDSISMSEVEAVVSLTLTVDEPTDGGTVTDATVLVDWTLGGGGGGSQYSYLVRVFSDSSCTTEVYTSEETVSPLGEHSIPPLSLETGTTYWLKVIVTDTDGLQVASDCIEFTTDFSPSVSVENVTIERVGHMCEGDALPFLWLRWSAVSPAGAETFVSYDVYRRKAGEVAWTRIAAIDDRLDVQYKDYGVISRQWYEYAIVWEAQTASGILVSPFQTPPPISMVRYDWNFLHEYDNPSFWVPLLAFDVNVTSTADVQYRRAWGRRKPTAFVGEGWSESIEVTGLEQMRANKERWDQFRNLISRQYTAGSVLVLRSGIDRTLHYVQLSQVSRGTVNQLQYTPSLSLQEVHYDEAV